MLTSATTSDKEFGRNPIGPKGCGGTAPLLLSRKSEPSRSQRLLGYLENEPLEYTTLPPTMVMITSSSEIWSSGTVM